MTSRVVAKPTF